MMSLDKRHETVGVRVGGVQVGGGAPIVVQSMTNTDTADAEGTAKQIVELAEAGSDLVRITVNVHEAAAAVPEIARRVRDAGCDAPIIGDFHYNGHVLLTKYPDCAEALDKYRINPGNVGAGKKRDPQFNTICEIAADNGKPVRIGVNAESLNQELVMQRMQENIKNLGSRLTVITDSLGNKIEETNYLLSQVEERLREDIRRVESDVRALSDEMTTYKRRTNRSILDMQDALSTLEDDLKALQEKVEPEED